MSTAFADTNWLYSDVQSDTPEHVGSTEIIVPRSEQSLMLLLPTIVYLSQNLDNRWLTIVSKSRVSGKLLARFGCNKKKIRIIYVKNKSFVFDYLKTALANGKSHTVIGNPGKLTKSQTKQLENAARCGNAQSITVRAST